MAGKILTEVISSDERGLIGVTESGEEIPLSSPEASFFKVKVPLGGVWRGGQLREFRKRAYDKMLKDILKEKGVYISLGQKDESTFETLQPYNKYTRRK